jgi:GT2 family glycosyltransferase
MLKISIITVTYNNLERDCKRLKAWRSNLAGVRAYRLDGGSTDGSVVLESKSQQFSY